MVNDYEGPDNPQRDLLEMRIAIETLQRLRQILNAQRCVVCTSPITPESPAVLTIFDLAICGQPECAVVILDVPVGELGPTELKLRYHLTSDISLLQRDLQAALWLFSALLLISDFAWNRHYFTVLGPSPTIFRRFLQRSASAKCKKGNSGDTRGSLLGLVAASVL